MTKEKKAEELKDEQLDQVVGGNNSNNPLGLTPGDSVIFFNRRIALWMWGTFGHYDGHCYYVKWGPTTFTHSAGSAVLPAGDEALEEKYLNGSASDLGTSRLP